MGLIGRLIRHSIPFRRAAFRWAIRIAACLGAAVQGAPDESALSFRHLTLEDGLSQSNVAAIAQDHSGFIWVGTQDGLNRYDGYSFRIYRHNPADPASLSDNYIWRLLVDRSGVLWVGTNSGGLNRYDPDSDGFSAWRQAPGTLSGLLSDNVSMLYEDRSGALWVGCWGGGLSRMDSARSGFTHFRHDPGDAASLISPDVGAFLEDAAGTIWVGTWDGLARMQTAGNGLVTVRRYGSDPDHPDSLRSEKIWALAEDPSSPGNILVGTYGGGVRVYDRERDAFFCPAFEPPSGGGAGRAITALTVDRSGNIWVGAYGDGLTLFDVERSSTVQFRADPANPFGLPGDEVLALLQDQAGALWVGTGNGLSVQDLRRQTFLHFRSRPGSRRGLSHPKVRAVLEDREGGLWVGTRGGGLDYRPPGGDTFLRYRHEPDDPGSLSADRVTCILERHNGELWVGTEEGGLNRFERRGGVFSRYRHDPQDPASLAGNSVMTLHEDRAGRLWVGTSGNGLDRLDSSGNGFIHYPGRPDSANALSGNHIWGLFEDRFGVLWVGTWGRGVNRFDVANDRIRPFLSDPADSTSIPNNTVWAFAEDAAGNMWMGTWGGGLVLYDRTRERFSRLTERDGLPNNTVYGILPDSAGALWISTNRGLARLSWNGPGGAPGDPAHPRRGLSIRIFDAGDGLQSNEFNQGAFAAGRSGMLWFGGINGLNGFDPGRMNETGILPPIVITGVRVFERPVTGLARLLAGEPLYLPHDQNFFSFEFAALDYSAPGKNEYAYRMEGLHADWVYAGTRRYVNFTHLDPGEYRFRVKGSNGDGRWHDPGTAIRIIIAPPVWGTWWFRLGGAGLAALLVYGIYRYRLKRMLEMERLRTRLAADLHDEIAGNLSSIALYGEIIRGGAGADGRLSGEAPAILERIIRLSTESVTAIRDIIWAIDPNPETLHDLLLRAQDFAAQMAAGQRLCLTVDLPPAETLPSRNLSPEERKHLWLLMKEALQNIIKHAGAREIRLSATWHDGVLNLDIIDDGRGFDPATVEPGKGTRTMTQRARELAGRLTITSAPGQGTIVRFRRPF